ncbi:MAG: AlpA family phage regulatory protein [Pseudomonadota bacterium]|nr:AlpA family phage regulatory protein [Pseudomonadota bacterium]
MGKGVRASKLTSRGNPAAHLAGSTTAPTQLSLPFFSSTESNARPAVNGADHLAHVSPKKPSPPLPALDRLTVREVLKIVPIDRSTLFRWVKNGRFPKRHKAGGWLRADIERWLTEHEGDGR